MKLRSLLPCLLSLISFASGQSLLAQNTVTIATFNAEWLGYPSNSGSWSSSRTSQIQRAASEILAVGAEIIALQEIIIDARNGNALLDLLDELNSRDPIGLWEGTYNPKFSYWWDPDFASFPAQRQAFVWRSTSVSFISSSVLLDFLNVGDSRFGSGRLPFLVTLEVGPSSNRQQIHLINLHLKCCRNNDDRRLASMSLLIDTLRLAYADDPLVILGDFNVADSGGASGEIATWGVYQDDDGDGLPDFSHAAGAVYNQSWNDIDHILVSNELVDNWESIPAAQRNTSSNSTVSDHDFVLTKLDFSPPSLAEQYNNWIQSHGSANPAILNHPDFGDDFDGDGIPNGLEFLTGSSPLMQSPSALKITTDISGNLIIQYQQRKDTPNGALQVLFSNSQLAVDSAQILEMPTTAIQVTQLTDPAFEEVTIQIQRPDTGQARFFHLKGTLTP
jgi:endonuclease/exonuclease/phosphatase family metal-dependent hydrolase